MPSEKVTVGLPHEVLIPVKEKGAVLTWDFDIVKGRCDFVIMLLADRFLPPIEGPVVYGNFACSLHRFTVLRHCCIT